MISPLVSVMFYNDSKLQIIFNNLGIIFKKTFIFAPPTGNLIMIQRIQTLYLIIVVALGAVLPFWVQLWTDADGSIVFAKQELAVSIAFYGSAVLALLAIMRFKDRKNQFVMNRFNMILNLFLLGFFVYRSLNLSGEALVSEKGIGMLIPVFSIVFLVLANRAIKKDEDLVKSVDRLR
jgi:hypothetical protein